MNRNQEKSTSGYIPGIDGLRAIAVLAVIAYHASPPLLPGGFAGVDVFFVISGYVISASLVRSSSKTFLHFTLGFYAKRILRILPALIVLLVITSIFSNLFIPRSWLSSSNMWTGLYAFIGISNFALIKFNDGYFAPRAEFNPFTHTWSLAAEEQFYFIFPLIFFIWLHYRYDRGVRGLVSSWALIGLLIVSLLFSWIETTANPDRAYYLIFSRFWELAAGAALFQLHRTGKFLPASASAATWILSAGLVTVMLALVLSDQERFPFPWAMLSVVGSTLTLIGVVDPNKRNSMVHRALANAGIVYIGRISYSLYLWHWPVFVLFRWTIGIQDPLYIALAIAITFISAMLSYHFVETPARRNRHILALPDWKIVSAGTLVIFISAGFTYMLFKAQPAISLSVTSRMEVWYPRSWYTSPEPENEENLFQGRRLFVIGDSHARAYKTMFALLEGKQGVDVRVFNSKCSISSLLRPSLDRLECKTDMAQFMSELDSDASSNDIVFLASLRMNRVGSQWASFDKAEVLANQSSLNSRRERERALAESDEILRRLFEITPNVIIDAPKPVFQSAPYRCTDVFNSSNPACVAGFEMDRSFLLDLRTPVMESLTILKSKFSNLTVWDPFPILCEGEICSAFDGNMPLFLDGDHLSAYGNRVLYPEFEDLLKTIWKPN